MRNFKVAGTRRVSIAGACGPVVFVGTSTRESSTVEESFKYGPEHAAKSTRTSFRQKVLTTSQARIYSCTFDIPGLTERRKVRKRTRMKHKNEEWNIVICIHGSWSRYPKTSFIVQKIRNILLAYVSLRSGGNSTPLWPLPTSIVEVP